MITNVMMKTCLNQNIMKISNFIHTVKCSVCPNAKINPKAEFLRKPNLSEYLPNVPKCGLNTRHDNREVTLSVNFAL